MSISPLNATLPASRYDLSTPPNISPSTTPTMIRRQYLSLPVTPRSAIEDSSDDSIPSGQTSRKPGKHRRAYSVEEKIQALEVFEKTNSVRQTAKLTGISRRQIQRWRYQKEELDGMAQTGNNQRLRLPGGGRMLTSPVLEIKLMGNFFL